MSRVLVLEAEQEIGDMYRQLLRRQALVEVARSVTGAEELADMYEYRFDLVVVDACVPFRVFENFTTELPAASFVRKLRANHYSGPIIATATDEESLKVLKDAGCDFQILRPEQAGLLPSLVRKLLKL